MSPRSLIHAALQLLVVVGLFLLTFSLPGQAQTNSGAAGIVLQATLAPSLSILAIPAPIPLDSFIGLTGTRNLPVTVKANWVRGSGEMSMMVLTTSDFQSWHSSETISAMGAHSETTRELQISSSDLKLDGGNRVLTIRAQAL